MVVNHKLTEQVQVLENEVMPRNRVISDIELKFTDYLKEYYQSVRTEVETLSEMLSRSTTEVHEYQAELMVAAQDDEGSTRRIEEPDRRANLAESVAKRIHDKGMIMREEYQDQVHHLQGLLLQTEDRVRQMEHGSEYAQNLATHLYAEGTEIQRNMENAVMSFRQENQLALVNNTDLQITNQRTHDELAESNQEVIALRRHLEMAQRENRNNEEQVRKVVHECRIKVTEANQRCVESEHRLCLLRNDTEAKNERERGLEAPHVAENLLKDQQMAGLREEIMRLDKMLKESVMPIGENGPTFGSSPRMHPMIENLESELKVQKLTNGDLVDEANEYIRDNIQLKDEVSELKSKMASVSSGASLDKFKAKLIEDFKSELVIERKSRLKALSEKDTKIWTLQKDQDDKRVDLIGKDGKIARLEARIRIMEQDAESTLATLPFSAGMTETDCQKMMDDLRLELENEKSEHAVTKAYYRQVDDAYNQEAEELAELMRKSHGTSEQKVEGKPTEKSKEEKTGKPRSFSPPENRRVPASIQDHLDRQMSILRILALLDHHHLEAQRLMTICRNPTSQ